MSQRAARQLSLEQPVVKKPSQSQTMIRKQKSADGKRSFHINTSASYSDKCLRSKKENAWNSERPSIKMAWNAQDDSNVEVIASKIGTVTNKKTSLLSSLGSSSILESDKATILYSRQELAERLRLAWKQREANKSNIDIFLAHGTTADESRCESRLSTTNCNNQNHKNISLSSLISPASSPVYFSSKKQDNQAKEVDKEIKHVVDAKTKRNSFQAGTNLAFTGLINNKTSTYVKFNDKKPGKTEKSINNSITTPIIDVNKKKRTNSAPPLQRRTSSVTLGCLPSASSKSRVNIIIDTPKIAGNKEDNVDKKNFNLSENLIVDSTIEDSSSQNSFIPVSNNNNNNNNNINNNNSSLPVNDKSKNFVFKKRARSGKRRVEEVEKKNECKSNLDVVTMVSLISDADSDSEIEKNSPRDNKLVRQLKNNLPMMPIIKRCSGLMMNTQNLGTVTKNSENSSVPRRVFKTVSFQQDSPEKDDNLRKIEIDKRNGYFNEGLSKMIIQQQTQHQQVIDDPDQEDTRNLWQYDADSKNLSFPVFSNYWKTNEELTPLTDKEKRCLIVPINNPTDKKRKLLLQRTKSVPSEVTYIEQPLTMQIDQREISISSAKQIDASFIHQIEENTVALQTSISKLAQKNNCEEFNQVDMEASDTDIQSIEPHLRTTKEKECWHLYKKMCDKGVCVSFDTVLRGMLTPTEYRLRRREVT